LLSNQWRQTKLLRRPKIDENTSVELFSAFLPNKKGRENNMAPNQNTRAGAPIVIS
jgi:hypothetical protein